MVDKTIHNRLLFLGIALTMVLSCLSLRLFDLQYVDSSGYAVRAQKSYTRTQVLPHSRGKIVDRHDDLLAYDLPVTAVYCDKYQLVKEDAVPIAAYALAQRELSKNPAFNDLPAETKEAKRRTKRAWILRNMKDQDILDEHIDYVIQVLARPLGLPEDELRRKIMSRSMDIRLEKDLPDDVADNLEAVVRDSCIGGIRFEKKSRRFYTKPDLAAHIVGYVGATADRDQVVGQVGIERFFDGRLTGKDGYRTFKRDRYGLPMALHEGKLMPPVPGLNVQLTIDSRLQSFAEEELQRGMEEFQAGRGSIVLANPKTGEILAMASAPTFDLNSKKGLSNGSLCFSHGAVYEPGSTFKIIAAAAALDQGHVSLSSEIFCHWGKYHKKTVKISDHGSYGKIPVSKVMAKSSNIGAYKLALLAGFDTFHDYAGRFGFGNKTNIPIYGEKSGHVLHSDNPSDFSRLTFGYTVNTTPLQVTMAYCAIANGGTLMRPMLVKSIMAPDGTPLMVGQPEKVHRVMKKSTARQLRQALAGVVRKGGTATQAAVAGHTVGGKTGTADRFDEKTNTYMKEEGRNVVSFAGMLPADDPEFVCVVVMDDPQTTEVPRYGGHVAAPIFSRMAARTAHYMNLTPSEVSKADLAHSTKR